MSCISMFDLPRLVILVHNSISVIATSYSGLGVSHELMPNPVQCLDDASVFVVVNLNHAGKHGNVHLQMDLTKCSSWINRNESQNTGGLFTPQVFSALPFGPPTGGFCMATSATT
jgi:hypothetical protein